MKYHWFVKFIRERNRIQVKAFEIFFLCFIYFCDKVRIRFTDSICAQEIEEHLNFIISQENTAYLGSTIK